MAAAEEIRGIDKVFSYTTPVDKSYLIRVNMVRDAPLQPIGQHLGNELHGEIL